MDLDYTARKPVRLQVALRKHQRQLHALLNHKMELQWSLWVQIKRVLTFDGLLVFFFLRFEGVGVEGLGFGCTWALGLGAARGLWGSGLSGFRAAGPRIYKDYGNIQN